MYQSLSMQKKSPPKVNTVQKSVILNEQVLPAKIMEDGSSLRASIMKKISAQTPVQQKKIKQLYSFNDERTKAKSIVIDYIDHVLKITSFSQDVFSNIQGIEKAQNFNQMISAILKTISNLCEVQKHIYLHKYLQKQKSKVFEKEVSLTVRSREAKLLRIIKEEGDTDRNERGKSKKKYDEMLSANEAMKKQIFELREEKFQLEKKILEIIEEYKNRKAFYLAQIKKLTDIVSMSSFDVRTLIMEKTREAKYLEQKIDPSRGQEGSTVDIIVNNRQAQQSEEQRERYPSSNNLTFNQPGRPPSPRESRGIFNGYNTQLKILKGISSVQKLDELHHDSHVAY